MAKNTELVSKMHEIEHSHFLQHGKLPNRATDAVYGSMYKEKKTCYSHFMYPQTGVIVSICVQYA